MQKFAINMAKIMLLSGDKKFYQVSIEVTKQLGFIGEVVQSHLALFPDDHLDIGVQSKILSKMIEWTTLQRCEPVVEGQVLPSWYNRYFEMNLKLLMDLTWVTNSLEMQDLYEHSFRMLDKTMKVKSRQQIRAAAAPRKPKKVTKK